MKALIRAMCAALTPLFFVSLLNAQPGSCGGGACSVCNVTATITNITGGTIVNGTSNITGSVPAGGVGTGSLLQVDANQCGSVFLTVSVNFNWDGGVSLAWLHGVSFFASPG